MTFFNQPCTPCGAVQRGGDAGEVGGFIFQLDKLPSLVERVVIAVSASGAGVMSQIKTGHLKLVESQGAHAFARFDFTDFTGSVSPPSRL